MDVIAVKRALISVHDKKDVVDFARSLVEAGVELVSSGGTEQALVAAGVLVTPVATVTGFPEILGGRVKTLHPSIHGGILGRPDVASDIKDLERHNISSFQLVVCNLYPFRETIVKPQATESEIIEDIDIGGPAMVRAAAKNHQYVGVVTSPVQYEMVAKAVANGGLTLELRRQLAATAFDVTASYDAAIATWLQSGEQLPLHLTLSLQRQQLLRYGENPHQTGALYVEEGATPWWKQARLIQGKEMSFNNYVDAEAAWRLACDLPSPAAVVVKHTNPCGAAVAKSSREAFQMAWQGDAQAAYGGVVALNTPLDGETAQELAHLFVEVLVVPAIEDVGPLATTSSLRVLVAPPPSYDDLDYRRLHGGFVVQQRDIDGGEWVVASARTPTDHEWTDLRIAWTIAMHSKSNAIALVAAGAAVGIGAGDQSRIGSARRALTVAGDRAKGAVAASDAFFPFRDAVDLLSAAGVTAIVQPGGSRRDNEVIVAANELGLSLVHTGMRHFLH